VPIAITFQQLEDKLAACALAKTVLPDLKAYQTMWDLTGDRSAAACAVAGVSLPKSFLEPTWGARYKTKDNDRCWLKDGTSAENNPGMFSEEAHHAVHIWDW
jgi:hypothetical protein